MIVINNAVNLKIVNLIPWIAVSCTQPTLSVGIFNNISIQGVGLGYVHPLPPPRPHPAWVKAGLALAGSWGGAGGWGGGGGAQHLSYSSL